MRVFGSGDREMSAAAAGRNGQLAIICTMSCKEALIELVPVFEREKGYAVDVTYGAGPELARKIREGLRADVFVGPEEFSGPFIQEMILDGATRTFTDIQLDVPVDDAVFARPPAATAAGK